MALVEYAMLFVALKTTITTSRATRQVYEFNPQGAPRAFATRRTGCHISLYPHPSFRDPKRHIRKLRNVRSESDHPVQKKSCSSKENGGYPTYSMRRASRCTFTRCFFRGGGDCPRGFPPASPKQWILRRRMPHWMPPPRGPPPRRLL